MSHQKSRYEHDPPRIFKQLQPKKQIWTGRILMIHMGGGYPRLHTKPLCWREIYTFILCAEILWCIFVGWVGFWKHSLHTKHVRMILFCPRNMNGTVSNWKKVVEFACSWKTHIYIHMLWTRWTTSPQVRGRKKTCNNWKLKRSTKWLPIPWNMTYIHMCRIWIPSEIIH